MRLTAAGAKYGFLEEANHSARAGRYFGLAMVGTSGPPKIFALPTPMSLLGSRGSGMGTMPGGLAAIALALAPPTLPPCGAPSSVTFAVPCTLLFLAPTWRSVRVWAKKAAMPQKSFGVQF